MKYLVRGHTFIGADSVHGAFGNKMQNVLFIVNCADFVSLCQTASCKIQSIELQTNNFHDFQKGKIRSHKTKILVLLMIKNICEVRFVKGSKIMF